MKIIFPSTPFVFLLMLISFPIILSAQDYNVEMADLMRENGKIYVVIAVISVILIGFLFALINVDRKVRQLEKDSKKD